MDLSRVGSSARAGARPSGPLAAPCALPSGPRASSTRVSASSSVLRSICAVAVVRAAPRSAPRPLPPTLTTRARPGGSLARGGPGGRSGRPLAARAASPPVEGEFEVASAAASAEAVGGAPGERAERALDARAFGAARGPAGSDSSAAPVADGASRSAENAGSVASGASAASGGVGAPPAGPRRAPSQLVQRALSGAALGAAALAAVLRGGRVFALCVILASFQASHEMAAMLSALESAQRDAESALRTARAEERGGRADGGGGGGAPSAPRAAASSASAPSPESSALTSALVTAGAVLIPALVALGRSPRAGGLGLTLFCVLAAQLFTEGRPRFGQLASAAFRVLYCGYLPSFWIRLRELGRPGALVLPGPEAALMAEAGGSAAALAGLPAAPGGGWLSPLPTRSLGCRAVLLTVLCVAMADTGAYFVGRALGRTPLSPASPKKTLEGALGGLSASLGAALLSHLALGWPSTPARAAAFAALVFSCSIIGDLIESSIKRDAGVKDSGTLIPGHGGVLDRLDSYIFTAPCVYWLLVEGLPGL